MNKDDSDNGWATYSDLCRESLLFYVVIERARVEILFAAVLGIFVLSPVPQVIHLYKHEYLAIEAERSWPSG